MFLPLQNTFKILWPYLLCGAFSASIWFTDFSPYLPLTVLSLYVLTAHKGWPLFKNQAFMPLRIFFPRKA